MGTLCWADFVEGAKSGRLGAADRERFVDHVASCEQCRRALAALDVNGSPFERTGGAELQPDTAARIRDRLVGRAASDRQIRSRPGRPRLNLPAGAGWLVAAGMATLLLSHHAFHRPLLMGWIIAAILSLLCFGLGVSAYVQRREVERMREQLASLRTRREEKRAGR